jgi:hypothetical protein
MTLPPNRRSSVLLESAVQRVKLAARAAVERAVEGLGLAALASTKAYQRDTLLNAQFELNRRSAMFALSFNEALDERVRRESAPRPEGGRVTDWGAMSLVDDQEVERQVSAERFGLEIAHACEWELRELDAYMGSLLGTAQDRNPLRPEVLGLALIKGVETTSERAEVRSLLMSELGRVLAQEMRGTYAAIVADLGKAGIQPAGLSVRPTADAGRHTSGYDSLTDVGASVSGQMPATGRSRLGPGTTTGARLGAHDMGQVDARMMSIIRRLVHIDAGLPPDGASSWSESGSGTAPPPNVIQAHRDELRQAARGSLDHMVIDIIGTLFDQILSDPKVSPQMARQIGRLQLPVLRAALGDPSFFSSRRHPVRRFINRIASLAAAFDDFGAEDARRFLAQVRDLVQGIVDGDFEQVDVYERQLAELERLVAALAQEEARAQGNPGELLGRKEDEWLTAQRYAAVLQVELQGLEGPEFVRDFLTEVWSQVLVQAARRHGADSEAFARMRGLARELFMSVLPKGMPAQRKEFLARLPKLMQGLNEGMDLIGWPDSARKAFFGLLLPAHAQSLKGQAMRTLDYNLLAKRLDSAFEIPLPTQTERPAPGVPLPVLSDTIAAPRFSAEEAARVGLVDESRIDWSAPVGSAPQSEAPVTEVDIEIAGLPAPEPVEPTQGPDLVDHVQLGFAYQMHLDGDWHKVKLTHVSQGRNFFVFSRGRRHRQTISLTRRMLVRLCETGRLRAFESAYLLDRATARARRQLSSLAAPA